MAYGPLNARSELVTPLNFSDAGVFESSFRFQNACAAFSTPALRPTRGSGLGATCDMLFPPDEAQAARPIESDSAPSVRRELTANPMVASCEWMKTGGRFIGRARRTAGWRACAASDRFRSSGRRRRPTRT